jgi:hypothetical protein
MQHFQLDLEKVVETRSVERKQTRRQSGELCQLRKWVSQAEIRQARQTSPQHCLASKTQATRLGWCISLSSVILTSDIGAPGVLLDVIEQNHGDKVCGGQIEFVRHLPSGRALILHTPAVICGEVTALDSGKSSLRLSREFCSASPTSSVYKRKVTCYVSRKYR